MTDRDAFASAALTGLLAAPTDKDRSWEYWARLAYEAADAMVREQARTNHDAAPAAKARTEAESTRTDKADPLPGKGTGDSLSKAEIDALQHVVEDGQIVKMWDYARLRRLLIRLRPEWEDEPYEKSDEKRGDSNTLDRLAALERLSALDQELERTHGVRHTQAECTKQDECSVPDSRTENEPVAWLVNGVMYDTGHEYEYVTEFKENAEAAAAQGGCVVPLYRQPSPAIAKSAVAWAVVSDAGVYDSSFGDKEEAYEWRAEVMAEMGREYFVVPLYRLEGQQ